MSRASTFETFCYEKIVTKPSGFGLANFISYYLYLFSITNLQHSQFLKIDKCHKMKLVDLSSYSTQGFASNSKIGSNIIIGYSLNDFGFFDQ